MSEAAPKSGDQVAGLSAWSEGLKAFEQGKHEFENPYLPSNGAGTVTPLAAGWGNGWRFGRDKEGTRQQLVLNTAASVLAKIDAELGLPLDGTYSPMRTLEAIRALKLRDAQSSMARERLKGQPQGATSGVTPERSSRAALCTSPLFELHGLDTDEEVFFYEQDFYVLSNFSAFSLKWQGRRFPTSEHAYHWEKFSRGQVDGKVYVRDAIIDSVSAHEAFKLAERWKPLRRHDWDDVKVVTMRAILREKARQHEYVRRKLLATGDRTLIENSWRDDFWGWGPNRDGQNMLGKLWMELREELRAAALSAAGSSKHETGCVPQPGSA